MKKRIQTLLFFAIISFSVLQADQTEKKAFIKSVTGYSSLSFSFLGFVSLFDQIINKDYSLKKSIFTGSCLGASLVSALSYLYLPYLNSQNRAIRKNNRGKHVGIPSDQTYDSESEFNDVRILHGGDSFYHSVCGTVHTINNKKYNYLEKDVYIFNGKELIDRAGYKIKPD